LEWINREVNIMKKINKKKIFAAFTAVAAITAMSIPAFALGTADATVTTAFTGLKDDVIATLGVVAGLGVGVMAIFLAWKYGRKIFNQVAK
jgi:hypothetical protein